MLMKLSEIASKQNQMFSPFRAWLEEAIELLGDIESPAPENKLREVFNKGWHPKRIKELGAL